MTTHEHWTLPTEAADNPDAELIALSDERERLNDQLDGGNEQDEAMEKALLARLRTIGFRMARTPASTIKGLHIKAEIAADNLPPEHVEFGDEANLLGLLDDLRRLAGRVPQ